MNLFFSLPDDIINYIFFIVKISHSNCIIYHWRKYFFYKKFIIRYIQYSLPKFYSIINNNLIFSVVSKKHYFFYKKLFNITTGNESYLKYIYFCFYHLALSIQDYEWVSCRDNYYYSLNRYMCINITTKHNWNRILDLLE